MSSIFANTPEDAAGTRPEKKMLPGFGQPSRMIGLDVGSAMIKAVLLEHRDNLVTLKQAALAATPPGVSTAGVLTDGIAVARALKSVWNDYSLKESRVATAVSGDRVYCQMDRPSAGDSEDLASFVDRRIAETLSYSPDLASSGFQEVRGGVVWAAAPAEGIDWFRETVRLSSKTPAIIQTQSCALANAYSHGYQPDEAEAVLLLHVGARRASLVLLLGEVPVYGRDIVIDADWPVSGRSIPERVAAAIDLHWDQIELRSKPAEVSRVLVSGGAAQTPGLEEAVAEKTGLRVEALDAFRRVSYAAGEGPGRVAAEHRSSLAMAVGLALQGLEGL